MNTKIKIKKAQVKSIIAKTFPNYKGRSFFVEFTPSVTLHDTNWGGGTKNSYAAVNWDGQVKHAPTPAPWMNRMEGETVTISPDVVLVKHTVFCGQDLGITIYANPVNAPALLPAGG